MTTALLLLALVPALPLERAAPWVPPSVTATAPDLDLLMCQAIREQQLVEYRWREYEFFKDDLVMNIDAEGNRQGKRTFTTRYIHRSRPHGVGINEVVAKTGDQDQDIEAGEGKDAVEKRIADLRRDGRELARSVARQQAESRDKTAAMDPGEGIMDWRLEGVEDMDGKPCWVVSFRKHPHRNGKGGYFEKSVGVAWVGMAHPALLRLELNFITHVNVKFGPFATMTPGSTMLLHLGEARPGVLLTKSFELDLRLRLFFIAHRYQFRGTYYRDFRRVNGAWPEFVP